MSPKLIIGTVVILALVGLATLGIHAFREYGTTQYKAGYNARISDEAGAREKAQIKADQLAEIQRGKIDELEKDLRDSQTNSERLSAQIRDAEYTCDHLGAEFLRLFNLGAKGDISADSLEARP